MSVKIVIVKWFFGSPPSKLSNLGQVKDRQITSAALKTFHRRFPLMVELFVQKRCKIENLEKIGLVRDWKRKKTLFADHELWKKLFTTRGCGWQTENRKNSIKKQTLSLNFNFHESRRTRDVSGNFHIVITIINIYRRNVNHALFLLLFHSQHCVCQLEIGS